ncbi:MAG: stressosome-associated protein Prli42 [Acidimicrobiia bacterium]
MQNKKFTRVVIWVVVIGMVLSLIVAAATLFY